jgi:hypothetical protein
MSTGLLLGGYAVAFMTLAGRMNAYGLLHTSLGLFLVGAFGGMVLASVGGVLGREEGVTGVEAARRLGMGLIYAIPAVCIGTVLAGWIAMAVVGLYLGKVAPIAGSAIAALIAAGIMVATARVSWRCVRNMGRRLLPAA